MGAHTLLSLAMKNSNSNPERKVDSLSLLGLDPDFQNETRLKES
jgi:hypothetical protein